LQTIFESQQENFGNAEEFHTNAILPKPKESQDTNRTSPHRQGPLFMTPTVILPNVEPTAAAILFAISRSVA
jgi:hypothetical protein